jgi:ribonuclease HI
MKIHIYTDGSSDNNNPDRPMGWCAVLHAIDIGNGEILKQHEIVNGGRGGSNNIAEIMAVKEALEYIVTPGHDITIFTDSTYIRDLFGGCNIKSNAELIEEMFVTSRRHTIKVVQENGHQGEKWNEHCHKKAYEMFHIMAKLAPKSKVIKVGVMHIDNEWLWSELVAKTKWSEKYSNSPYTLFCVMDNMVKDEIDAISIEVATEVMANAGSDAMMFINDSAN